jgi:hypothetical protein
MSGLASAGLSHTGAVRSRNEDALVDMPEAGLWAVADGAGGHGAGDVASAAIAEALAGIPPQLSAAELLAQVRLRLAGVHASLLARPPLAGRSSPPPPPPTPRPPRRSSRCCCAAGTMPASGRGIRAATSGGAACFRA